VEGDEVRIRPARLSLEAIYGAVRPLAVPEDFERIEQVAGEERAGQCADEAGQGDAVR